jgi:hypothetical protein
MRQRHASDHSARESAGRRSETAVLPPRRTRPVALLTAFVITMLACTEPGDPQLKAAASGGVEVAARDAVADSASARRFLAAFYSQYLQSRPEVPRDAPAWHVVLTEHTEVFGDRLLEALRNDRDRWAAAPEGVSAGLEFDPMLGTQDPCDAYEQGSVGIRDGRVSVELRCSAPNSPVDAVAELERFMGAWRIVDFYYPTVKEHLTTILAR